MGKTKSRPAVPSRVAIIGGGIVGLATAHRLLERMPDARVTVLEKEKELGCHQTGHNSGVLHSGIYYMPGSLKALNCRQGREAMVEFCRRHDIPHDVCGKVIVAIEESEIAALERILERGRENGIACEWIEPDRLKELEPHVAGIRAIHVPEAGIVDFRQVCLKLGELVTCAGGEIVTGAKVKRIASRAGETELATAAGDFTCDWVVNCGGLYSDRVARLSGARTGVKIIPFRGEFYRLLPEAEHLCRNLIYPVPDPSFPFLGVHFTRVIEGGIECGPNAVLAFAREGYRKTDVNLRDLAETLSYQGFLRLSAKHWRAGLGELWRSFSKRAFVGALQRLIPEVRPEHLESAPAGVRAQAVSPDGKLVDDFLIEAHDRVVNVCNAPSPAATASLNVGRLVVDELVRRME
jgi:L-2-hydroxyglutarate oxidase